MFTCWSIPKYLNVLVPQYKYKNTLLRKALFSVPMSSRYGYDLDVLEKRVWPLIRWANLGFNQVLMSCMLQPWSYSAECVTAFKVSLGLSQISNVGQILFANFSNVGDIFSMCFPWSYFH